jgi:hypothetical protein
MDTLEYITSNLSKTLTLKTKTHSLRVYKGVAQVSIDVYYSLPAKPITANTDWLAKQYNPRAVNKNKHRAQIPWDQLATLELADHQLKILLELTCHIYTNDTYTQYYDPSLLSDIEPAKYIPPPKPVVDPDMPRYSSKPDIAAMVMAQLEADAAWDPTSLIAEIRGNKHA